MLTQTNPDIRVGIIGLGYVGLPLSLAFLNAGLKVRGFDNNPKKINALINLERYIEAPWFDHLFPYIASAQFIPTSDPRYIADCTHILICVPTPLGVHKEPDTSYISSAVDWILPHLQRGSLLVLESTTYPGTTEEIILPKIISSGFQPGVDFFIGYSPEREDPGNANYSTTSIPKLVAGLTPKCLKKSLQLYKYAVRDVVPVDSIQTAEFTKLYENIYRCVNIGLANEMKLLAHRLDLNIFDIIKAASTKPFGFSPFFPGPGLGGHCIPVDPHYMTWKAKEVGLDLLFIETAARINESMPNYVVDRAMIILNNMGKSPSSSRILLLGVSYKKNIDDVRDSPAIPIISRLNSLGASLDYYDPFVSNFAPKESLSFQSLSLGSLLEQTFDLGIIITDHTIDYDRIFDRCSFILDTRGITTISDPRFYQA